MISNRPRLRLAAVIASLSLVCESMRLSGGTSSQSESMMLQSLASTREEGARSLRELAGKGRMDEVRELHEALRRNDRHVGRKMGHAPAGSMAAVPDSDALGRTMWPWSRKRSGIVSPISFGADPSGRRDSTHAFQKALQALLSDHPGHTLSSGIKDLGGRTLDLEGGDFLISKPLVIPGFYGNFFVKTGTIRASRWFPRDRWLFEIGEKDCNPDYAKACNEFITFEDLLLDASSRAAGCLWIINSMGIGVGPAIFVEGFKDVGVRIDGGHETLISEAWFVERFWSDITHSYSSDSIAIQINGNDHYVVNTIIWQYTHLGVEVNGGANLLLGVHAWGCGQPWCNELTGISVKAFQNRIIACYLDYNSLDLVDPDAIFINHNFFLFSPLRLIAEKGNMKRLVVTDNLFTSADPIEVVGDFTAVQDVTVQQNVGYDSTIRSTFVRQSQHGPRQKFIFNLSSSLLLPDIEHLQYSLAWNPSSASISKPLPTPSVYVSGSEVTIAFNRVFDGSAFLEARCCGGGPGIAAIPSASDGRRDLIDAV